MKTNIKMRVTPEQSKRVQEICFKNNITWNSVSKSKIAHCLEYSCLYIGEIHITHSFSNNDYFNLHLYQEIDADLFIRTNGSCEENTFNELFEKVSERVNDFQIGNRIEPLDKYAELENKLKKKNEILKKARIKRKNQREELHKLNLKLQKCISLEEHAEALNDSYLRNSQLENDFREVRNLLTIKNNVIKELENENYLNKSKLHLSSLNNIEQQKEIEKLKAVIEYLESKAK